MKKKKNIVTEMTLNGDVITAATQYGDNNETISFKLGEKAKSNVAGMEIEVRVICTNLANRG